jgi:Tol biopolymer transport system component/sugar phosphate isomerase/epimerase
LTALTVLFSGHKKTEETMPRSFAAALLSLFLLGASAQAQQSVSAAGGAYADKLALQLYSLHDELAADLPGTLTQIAGLGFRNVEIYGLLGRTPEQFKAELDRAGLKAIGYHVSLAQLQTDVPGIIAQAKSLGIGTVGVAWIKPDSAGPDAGITAHDVDVAADAYNKACPALKAAGLHVFYHLHGFEFAHDETGRTLLDRFLAETDPSCVELQVDVFWVAKAGQDPVALLRRYPERIKLLHLKDIRKGAVLGEMTGHAPKQDFVAMGEGSIDWPHLLEAAREDGVAWYVIEDESADVIAQLKRSLRYLAEHPPITFRSHVEIYDIKTRTAEELFAADGVWEAPNWSPDGKSLLVNSGPKLYRLDIAGRVPAEIPLGGLLPNNDKGWSPDGKSIAFSAARAEGAPSLIYRAAADGSHPTLIESEGPSYFHGWAAGGRTIALVARRDGHFHLYSRAAEGVGADRQLTSAAADDDGPDYSPDGKWIYFNSNRSGNWAIWRMPKDGAGSGDSKAEQLTTGQEWEDWFPHPSPDGKHVLLISYPPGVMSHNARLGGMALRLTGPDGTKGGGKPETLLTFYGGQGSLNVGSWAPDSRRFAFVRYEEVTPHPQN